MIGYRTVLGLNCGCVASPRSLRCRTTCLARSAADHEQDSIRGISMAGDVLYFYVEGSGFDSVAPSILAALFALETSRPWCRDFWVVDDVLPREPSDPTGPTFRNLGVNYELPARWSQSPEWIGDVEEIARQVDRLAAATGREFVMGMSNADTGITEDCMHFDGSGANLVDLRAWVGVTTPGPS